MENQLKNAKKQLFKEELADFEFNVNMENRVLEEIKTTRKRSYITTKRFLPVVLSACLIALFFGGIYTFVINSDSGGPHANDTDQNIIVNEEKNPTPPEEESTIPQEENDEETIEPEPNSEQQEETPVTEETEIVEPEVVDPVYFDQEFISLANQGFLKGVPFQIGTTVGEIKAQYGEPLEYGATEGAFTLVYEGVSFYYPAFAEYAQRVNVADDVAIVGISLILNEKLFFSDIKTALGEPTFAGMSDVNYTFIAQFEIDGYILRVRNSTGEGDPLKSVEILPKT
jgi:hypothetical protein